MSNAPKSRKNFQDIYQTGIEEIFQASSSGVTWACDMQLECMQSLSVFKNPLPFLRPSIKIRCRMWAGMVTTTKSGERNAPNESPGR